MEKNSRILVDTDIIIKIFRGDNAKREILQPVQHLLGLSVITAMELMSGANSRKREFEVSKLVKAYVSYNLNDSIGIKAFTIFKKYHLQHSIMVADALIAATAIENKLYLYTDNTNDYSFITELKLFKQGDL